MTLSDKLTLLLPINHGSRRGRYRREQVYAFTLTELLVALVIMTIIIAFSLPNYTRSRDRSAERVAVSILQMISSANQLYFTRMGVYLPTGPDPSDVLYLNQQLNLSLVQPDIFNYSRNALFPDQFNAVIRLPNNCDLTVDQLNYEPCALVPANCLIVQRSC